MSSFGKTIWFITCIACLLILIGGQLKTEWQLRNYYKCFAQQNEVISLEDLPPLPEEWAHFDASNVVEMYATFQGIDADALTVAFE